MNYLFHFAWLKFRKFLAKSDLKPIREFYQPPIKYFKVKIIIYIVSSLIVIAYRQNSLTLFVQKFAFEKMEWPEEYTEGKIVPLMTLWDMKNIQERGRFNASMHLQPNR